MRRHRRWCASHILPPLTCLNSCEIEPPAPGVKYTEKDWNTKSTLTRNAYYFSKTLAEKAAWEFVENRSKDAFKLVVINPFVVIGPSHTATVNQSVKIVLDVFTGDMPRVEMTWGFVDVRYVTLLLF